MEAMKKLNLCMAVSLACVLAGCSQETLPPDPVSEGRAAAVSMLFPEEDGQTSPADSLKYKVYYFRAEKGSYTDIKDISSEKFQYRGSTAEWLTYDEFRNYVVGLTNKNLEEYYYKLVTVATSGKQPEIEFSYDEKDVQSQSTLADLKVRRTYNGEGRPYPLSRHNYVGVGNITEDAIVDGEVPVTFTRAVGELVFDFGRYSGLSTLALDEGYSSTLDRVCRIEVEVEHYTKELSWDMKQIIASEDTDRYTYDLSGYLDNGYKVNPDKAADNAHGLSGTLVIGTGDNGNGIPVGTTRFYGPYLLATHSYDVQTAEEDKKLNLTLTFHYYDTYPVNLEEGGDPAESSISLILPQENRYLTVLSNNYTVTKVKIELNRIIDMQKSWDSVLIDPSWK